MAINRGKQFEDSLRKQFEELDNTFVLRLYDVTMGYMNVSNPCDFIVFRYGILNLFELKAIHGNTLNFKSHIRENQWQQLLKYLEINGVNAGIICWFIDLDKTVFIPIEVLQCLKDKGYKSFNIKDEDMKRCYYEIAGYKKRVFFEYNLDYFLEEISV